MPNRRIRMIETTNGADTVLVKSYVEGEAYVVGKDLADAFIAQGVAVREKKKKKTESQSEPSPAEAAVTEPGETFEEFDRPEGSVS